MTEVVRKYGWKPDVPDFRDKYLLLPSTSEALPTKVDFRNHFSFVFNQGEIGSCTANAIGQAFIFAQNATATKIKKLKPDFVPSRLFLYYNEREIEGLIQLANEGFVDIAAVGNEVMFRKDMSENQLLEYIFRVKNAIPNSIPVGYVDNYYEFSFRSRITDVCDIILANCYPYWDGCPIDYALHHMKNMFQTTKSVGNNKRIIITETGWPSQGGSHGGAYASTENAMKYFIDSQKWSKQNEIEMFYFSSFDESWKVDVEGNVGAYWGIWDKNEKLKNDISNF